MTKLSGSLAYVRWNMLTFDTARSKLHQFKSYWSYQRVENEDRNLGSQPGWHTVKKASKLERRWLITLSVGVSAIILLAFIISTFQQPSGRLLCGHSPQEARQNNCKFDIMEMAWIPDPCHDVALSESYEPFRRWTFYADEEGIERLTEDDVRKGDRDVLYASWAYHQAHCAYVFDKMTRAVRSRKPINSRMMDAGHTNHCAHSMLGRKNVTKPTVAKMNFIPCEYKYT